MLKDGRYKYTFRLNKYDILLTAKKQETRIQIHKMN